MAEGFDEFLDELQRDIRQEKLLHLWRTYKGKITALLISLLSLVAGGTLWQNYINGSHLRAAQSFTSAQALIASGKKEQAVILLKDMQTIRGAYKIQSQLLLAALLAEPGPQYNFQQSLKIYEGVIEMSNAQEIFKDFARLMIVALKVSRKEDPQALLATLKPLLNPGNPWYTAAMELKGLLLIRGKDPVSAAETFSTIARTSKAPQGFAERAKLMSQFLLTQTKKS